MYGSPYTSGQVAVAEIGMISEEVRSQKALTTPAGAAKRSKAARTFSILLDPRLILWNLSLVIMSPVLLLMKVRRYRKKNAPQEFDSKRWFVDARVTRSSTGSHVVFVAASYGEVLLVERLSKALLASVPTLSITWAIRDPETLEEIKVKKPAQSVAIQPFDSFYPVVKWLNKVDPDVVILMERYNFPDLVASSKIWGAKTVLVNGRAKGAYQKAAGLVGPYYRWVFGSYSALLFQSDDDLSKVRTVCPSRTRAVQAGNIKLDVVAHQIDPAKGAAIRDWLMADSSAIVAAGSTDEIEEDRFVLDAFEKARGVRHFRLLLAPRNLDRIPQLLDEAHRRGFTTSLRSKNEGPADVHLLDTMGELAYAYSFAKAAYVGGSLLGMGHNLVEPLEWGIPVCYGLRRGHFETLQRLCEKSLVGFRLSTQDQLAEIWLRAISDPGFCAQVKNRAQLMLNRERGALDRTVGHLLEVLQDL